MFRIFSFSLVSLCCLFSIQGFAQPIPGTISLDLFSRSLEIIEEREDSAPFGGDDLEELVLPLLSSESPLIEFSLFNSDDGDVLGLRASNELGELVYFAYNHLDSDASILFSDGFVLNLEPNSLVGEFAQFSSDLVLDDLVGEFVLDGLSSSVVILIDSFDSWDGLGLTYSWVSNLLIVDDAGLIFTGAVSVTGTEYSDFFIFDSESSFPSSIDGGGSDDYMESSVSTGNQVEGSAVTLSSGWAIDSQVADLFSDEGSTTTPDILLIAGQRGDFSFDSSGMTSDDRITVFHIDETIALENEFVLTGVHNVITNGELNSINISPPPQSNAEQTVTFDSTSDVTIVDVVFDPDSKTVEIAQNNNEENVEQSNQSNGGGGAFGKFILLALTLLRLKSNLSIDSFRKSGL